MTTELQAAIASRVADLLAAAPKITDEQRAVAVRLLAKTRTYVADEVA